MDDMGLFTFWWIALSNGVELRELAAPPTRMIGSIRNT
jgi:hypothetical protein